MKISEKKALEAYPIAYYRNGGGIDDANAFDRAVYEEGYDQAFENFLEKAEEAISQISCHFIGEDYSFEQVWEQFKNYMEDED